MDNDTEYRFLDNYRLTNDIYDIALDSNRFIKDAVKQTVLNEISVLGNSLLVVNNMNLHYEKDVVDGFEYDNRRWKFRAHIEQNNNIDLFYGNSLVEIYFSVIKYFIFNKIKGDKIK